ncbi:MAG TPA: hypothetical protein VLK84_26670, partial [Longimicrobium sp.]|nr:hypothetical protein [Longimicrobium sp.]
MTDVIHPPTPPAAPATRSVAAAPVVEPTPESMRGLDPVRIIETIRALGVRIDERFPDRGLSRVARQQLNVAESTVAHVEWVRRPILWVRAAVGFVILLIVALVAGVAMRVNVPGGMHFADLIQAVDAANNELIQLGAAILFLATTESR